MDDYSFAQMREYIMATEYLLQVEPNHDVVESVVVMEAAPAAIDSSLLQELRDTMFKLRAFTESADGDISLGIEMGMQRAADMIENIINHHTQPGD
jgi:hypothetical protein